jgi:hypothetical protein
MINKQAFRLNKKGKPYCDCLCRHPELIENYDKAIADTTQIWEVHHRKEEFYSYKELIERGEYYDVQPEDLTFLTRKEHRKIDSANKRLSEAKKGKKLSEEHKRKISEMMRGKELSGKHKRKIGESLINRKDLSKKVLCVETGEVFESIHDASRKTGIRHISEACHGNCKTAGGYHWKFYN